MKLTRISHSRIDVFNECPYRYRLRYHDKIKSPLPEPPYFEFGHFVHKVLEIMMRDGKSVRSAAAEAYEKYNDFNQSYAARAPRMFRNFAHVNAQLMSANVLKDTVEVEFNEPVGEFNMNGFIDRAITYPQHLLIIDYKTSKPASEMSRDKVRKSGQLMKYVYAASRMFEIDVNQIRGAMFFLDSGNIHMAEFSQAQIDEHIAETEATAKKIVTMPPTEAKATIGWYCKFCEFRTICKHYRNR